MLYGTQLTLLLLSLLLLSSSRQSSAELIDGEEVDRFCYPAALRDSRLSCECSNVDAAPWGQRALHIDCSYKDYKTEQLSALLPLYVDSLDLSWNALTWAPQFYSDSLRQLNLMHNNISIVSAQNFVKLSNLRELYLSWNSIQLLQANAFEELAHLQMLDLSHNNLVVLPAQIFAPLLVLARLDLSWNRQLNQTTLDFYQSYGINGKLGALRLEACNLSSLHLPVGVPLKELSLRRNLFTRVPAELPAMLEHFDISENLLEQLLPQDTANLTRLQKLFLEDMSNLQSIASHALAPMQLLEMASFQNSRRLSSIDGHAFGINVTHWPTLRSLLFRGTLLRTFNSTLLPVFQQLAELDLNGLPLYCDCELVWLKSLTIETDGRCFKPARLRGMLVSTVRRDAFSCDRWPRWLYGIITFLLIMLCAACVYLVVMGLRPHRGVTLRRKVGAGSPYARVTIEPNRQENNFQ